MHRIFVIAAIGLTLIAGCSQTTHTAPAGNSFGSQYSDTTAKTWPPVRHSQGGRG